MPAPANATAAITLAHCIPVDIRKSLNSPPSILAHSAAGARVANCRSGGPVGVAPVLGAFEPGARRSALAAGAADVFAIVTGL